jgi:hypothetical protein
LPKGNIYSKPATDELQVSKNKNPQLEGYKPATPELHTSLNPHLVSVPFTAGAPPTVQAKKSTPKALGLFLI